MERDQLKYQFDLYYLEELILQFERKTNLPKIIIQQLGFESKLINPIENLLNEDKIQARIPFFIELK